MTKPIYLDYAATTPLDPRVAEKMWECLTLEGDFGNPSSSHVFGLSAKNLIDMARAHVADLIHAEPTDIIFTGSATESINLALKGAAELYHRKGKHIVTCKTEHKAVLDTCQQLEKQGYHITYLSPLPSGMLDIEEFKSALRDDTMLVSLMHVNNETGVIHDIAAIAQITTEKGILLHVDAAQSIGKLPIDVQKISIDLLSFNAHKVYGPKGVGALYVRKKPRVRVAAQIHGGGQEQGMRSGTLATHQIVGMGEALRLAKEEMHRDAAHLKNLYDQFIQGFKNMDVVVNAHDASRVPWIVNLQFPGKLAKDMLQQLPDVAVSTGSACLAKGIEPSYVLRALGLTEQAAHRSIRFSFGRFTTAEEIDSVIDLLQRVI